MSSNVKLKSSMYNYFCEDKDGNLLVCNFIKGIDSFSKIQSKDKTVFKNILANNDLMLDNSIILNKLYEKGILINNEVDEELLLKSYYYDRIIGNSLSLIIMPTESCNFRCTYCFQDHKKGKMTKDDQLSLLKFIQKRLTNLSGLSLDWFGGEPLEAFDVIDYLMKNISEICNKKKIVFTSRMTTNGYNLRSDIFDKLYKYKTFIYQITIDGTKENHDKNRVKINGAGTYDEIISNLTFIKNNKQYNLVRIIIRVNTSIEVLESIDDLIKQYKHIFGDDERFELAFYPVNDMGRSDSGININNGFTYLNSTDIHDKLNQCKIYDEHSIKLGNLTNIFFPMGSICYAADKNAFVIGSDLNVYKCSAYLDMRENRIGYIDKNGDLVIDKNLHNRWYIMKSERENCKSCFLYPTCYGVGCPKESAFSCNKSDICSVNDFKNKMSEYFDFISKIFTFDIVNLS